MRTHGGRLRMRGVEDAALSGQSTVDRLGEQPGQIIIVQVAEGAVGIAGHQERCACGGGRGGALADAGAGWTGQSGTAQN
jgi:hypothetical protein